MPKSIDSNALLSRIRENLLILEDEDGETTEDAMADAFEALANDVELLDDVLSNGGNLPSAWAPASASKVKESKVKETPVVRKKKSPKKEATKKAA